MLMGRSRRRLALWINERFFFGWVILAVAGIGIFASGPAQSHIFGIFLSKISDDLSASRLSVSWAYMIATLVASFSLPYVGRQVDRYGVASVFLVVSVLFGLGAIGFGYVNNILALGLGFAVLRFLGQGSLMLCCNNMVLHWFSRKRGLALGLMALGWAATMGIHPPFAQWLIEQVGWREAWLWLGLATWLILLPLGLLFVHSKPEHLGLTPDGAPPKSRADKESLDATEAADSVGLTLPQTLRTPAFWIIALALASLSMLVTGIFFHQLSVFETQGLDARIAKLVYPISAVSMVASMPVLGWFLDRFSSQRVFAGALLTMSGSLISLAFVSNTTTAIVYSILFGVANATIHTHTSFFWPRYFGRKHLGGIQGAGQTVVLVAASLGPLPLSIAYDNYKSYAGALMMLAAIPIVCGVLVLIMKPPKAGHS
jgi:MFS family permease